MILLKNKAILKTIALLTALLVFLAMPLSALAEADATPAASAEPQTDLPAEAPEGPAQKADDAGWDGSPAAGFSAGSGSVEDPFVIKTAGELAYLAYAVNNGISFAGEHIVLGDDIDLSGAGWTPIGAKGTAEKGGFEGSLDGGGHSVTGLDVKTEGSVGAGLFGCVGSGGSVTGVNVSGHVSAAGSEKAPAAAGGIAGQNYGVIAECSFAGTVTAAGENARAGGIAGMNAGALVSCGASGLYQTSGKGAAVGGIAAAQELGTAENTAFAIIINCISSAELLADNADACAGGIAGILDGGIMANSAFTGAIDAGKGAAGGAAGSVPSNEAGTIIANCYSAGRISGGESVSGGLFGNGSAIGLTVKDYYHNAKAAVGTLAGAGAFDGSGIAAASSDEMKAAAFAEKLTAGAAAYNDEAHVSGDNIYIADEWRADDPEKTNGGFPVTGSVRPMALKMHKLTVTGGEGGSVKVRGGLVDYKNGDMLMVGMTVTVTAKPAEGMVIGSLLVNGQAFESGKTLAVSGDVTVTAEFKAAPTYTVTYPETVENGAISVKAGAEALASGAAVVHGTELTIEAVPAEGYELKTLTVNGNALESGEKHTVSEDTVITAEFAPLPKSFTVTYAAAPTGGAVAVKGADGSTIASGDKVTEGTVLTITATPAEGYALKDLKVNDSAFVSGKTFTVNGDVTIVCSFAEVSTVTYKVTYPTELSSGSVKVTLNGETVKSGDSLPANSKIVITATPSTGYAINTLKINGEEFGSGGTYTLTGNTAITASFTATAKYKITYPTSLAGGSITVTDEDGKKVTSGTTVPYGTVLTIKASAKSGYKLNTLKVSGQTFKSGGKHTVTKATVVSASFTKSTGNPKTGDDANIPLLVTLMAISAGAICVLVVKLRRIKEQK